MKRILYKTAVPTQRGGKTIGYAGLDRKMFPALAGNDHVYLNSGASGPSPYAVIDAMRATEDLLDGPAYLEGTGLFARQAEAHARAREAAARLVGAAPDDVALTQNTTHGMNLGVASIGWREGDEAVSTSTEHPGCLAPLHNLRSSYGVKVRLVEPPVSAEKIGALLTERTRLVALSHVDWTSGDVLPLQEICALAREKGILTLVDGAQSVGNIPVDVPSTGADMYAFTGHKWLLGPEGMGALYVRPDLPPDQIRSTNVGYLSLADPADFDVSGGYELRSGARRFEASTMNPALAAGFAAAAEAARERGKNGLEEIRRRADLLLDLLSELPRVTIRSPRPPQSGLVSFEVEGADSKEVVARLLDEKFVLRSLPRPRSYVRASTHLFNSEEELEALAEAVGRL